MKITARNLGAIKEAEFDLKPLTILIGPNNAGKTWLAYTLAGIFGPYGFMKYLNTYVEENIQEYPPLDQAIKKLANGTNAIATVDLVQFIDEYGERYFNGIAHMMKTQLRDFMRSRFASFEDMEVAIDLSDLKTQLSARIKNYSVKSEVSVNRQQPLLRILKNRGTRDLHTYTESTSSNLSTLEEDSSEEDIEDVIERIPEEVIRELLVRRVFMAIHRALYPQVRVFPTERTTLITLPFHGKEETDIKELEGEELAEQDISSQKRHIRVAIGPINHFLSMIDSIFELSSADLAKRDEAAKRNRKIKEYIQLANLLEIEILGGKTDLSQAEPGLLREILFQPAQDTTLEIPIASSMVKELAPLVLYLRYLAQPGELLVIDEPEMNLHPEAQAKIIEFLAMLVNAGLHVLVTTHSPYVVDHLLNLRKASEYTDQEAISDRFFLQSKNAFISQQKSAVYLVDHGKIKNILDEEQEEERQEEDTFGKISDRISEIYFSF
jgi:predicted ATP-dependent endonuclease of OLD family